jgi:hypothetical protein
MRFASLAAVSAVALAAPLQAAVFVSSVSDYTAGALSTPRTNSAAAVGAPATVHAGGVLSPFNPAYANEDIVGIGAGGQITLSFATPIFDVPGPDVGVVTNIGLIDASFPSGTATNPAGTFNALPRVADVAVSSDGTTFLPVGRVTFENPANAFTNTPNPFDLEAPANPQPADFGKPFTGTLASFGGLSWTQSLALLNGSGGGTWIDVGPAGLASLRFVRFSIPQAGIAGSDDRFFVDAVMASNAAIPEPATLSLLAFGVAALARRPRR